jgi:hypothetical protein
MKMFWAEGERSEEEVRADASVFSEAMCQPWPKDLCTWLGAGFTAQREWADGRGPRPDLVSLVAAVRMEAARRARGTSTR